MDDPSNAGKGKALMSQFCYFLDIHIGRVAANFRVQGSEMAASLLTHTLGQKERALNHLVLSINPERLSNYMPVILLHQTPRVSSIRSE